ncbi:major facilitator superfamily domain-containing protein [Mycena belliarum]|uniref:Major facilitator superfamily domain-containing protein n=1 Tax=Mycena belliarum TaxID=1033014 RepID=A0AAD6XYI7_9AGAR|nr:major facilitator superfamily domain-containing protein [Mycena belliae]
MSTEIPDETQPLLGEHGRRGDQAAKTTPLPKAQLTALCVSGLLDPVAFQQIFPYINEFIVALHVTDDPSQVGFYSGVAESASSVAQILTIVQWTKLSDAVGRRPVILWGALGLAVVSLLLGLCQNFFQILVVRVLGGVLAGNVSVYHIVLGEITDGTNAPLAYPLFGCMYPLGSTIGPLIGGFFPHMSLGISFLKAYPYFLPGFVCACLSLVGFVATYFFLEESHPRKRRRRDLVNVADTADTTIRELLAIPRIRVLALSSFILSFLYTGHTVGFVLLCYLPIEEGGLAFSTTEIGYSLTIGAAVLALYQIFLMPPLLRKYDTARIYTACMAVWPISYALIAVLNTIARLGLSAQTARSKIEYTIALWVAIVVIQIVSRVALLSLETSVLLVRSNAPRASALSAANGFNMLAMSLARCTSPSLVSALATVSIEKNILGGQLWVALMTLLSIVGFFVARHVQNPAGNMMLQRGS